MKCQKIWLTQTHPIPSQQWLWRHEEQSPLLGWWHSRCWSQRYLQLSTTAGRLTVAWAQSLDLNSESHRWQIFRAPRGMCQIPEEKYTLNKQTNKQTNKQFNTNTISIKELVTLYSYIVDSHLNVFCKHVSSEVHTRDYWRVECIVRRGRLWCKCSPGPEIH